MSQNEDDAALVRALRSTGPALQEAGIYLDRQIREHVRIKSRPLADLGAEIIEDLCLDTINGVWRNLHGSSGDKIMAGEISLDQTIGLKWNNVVSAWLRAHRGPRRLISLQLSDDDGDRPYDLAKFSPPTLGEETMEDLFTTTGAAAEIVRAYCDIHSPPPVRFAAFMLWERHNWLRHMIGHMEQATAIDMVERCIPWPSGLADQPVLARTPAGTAAPVAGEIWSDICRRISSEDTQVHWAVATDLQINWNSVEQAASRLRADLRLFMAEPGVLRTDQKPGALFPLWPRKGAQP